MKKNQGKIISGLGLTLFVLEISALVAILVLFGVSFWSLSVSYGMGVYFMTIPLIIFLIPIMMIISILHMPFSINLDVKHYFFFDLALLIIGVLALFNLDTLFMMFHD